MLRTNGWEVSTIRMTSDADIQISLLTGSDLEFLLRFTILGLIGQLPNASIVHTQRTVELLPFYLLRSDAQMVVTCHGKDTLEMSLHRPWWVVSLYNAVESIAIRSADQVICVDQSTKQYLLQKHDLPDDRFVVIPVGADGTIFNPRSQAECRHQSDYELDDDILLFAGRLSEVKNLPLLLNTFVEVQRRRECFLVIAGDGGQREALERSLHKRGLNEFVNLCGTVEHHVLADLMNLADCLLLTSDHEGSPNVVREARACGLPVVSTDVGDVSQIITDNSQGYVVTERSPEVIADRVELVLDDNSASRSPDRKVLFEFTYNRIETLYFKN